MFAENVAGSLWVLGFAGFCVVCKHGGGRSYFSLGFGSYW